MKIAHGIGLTEALREINNAFNLGLGKFYPGDRKHEVNKKVSNVPAIISKPVTKLMQVVPRKYQAADYEYWNSYGIYNSTLALYSVYCVGQLYVDKKLVYSFTEDNPGYMYYFPKSEHMKVYFPFADGVRFLGNTNNYYDVQGYDQCRVKEDYEGKMLVLTKSMKDCMLLHQCGIDAMATHGETHKFTEDFMRHLFKYYPYIISLYDRDASGVKGAYYLWSNYRIPAVFIPRKYRNEGAKDITDLCKLFGRNILDNFVMNVLKKQA